MLVSYLGAKTAKKKLLFRKIDTTLKNLEINTIIANMPASVSLSSNYIAKRTLKIETGSDETNDGDGIVITNPIDKHASGRAARNLKKDRSNHNYSGLHYDSLVAFFIVKARHATVKDDNKINRNEMVINKALREIGVKRSTIKNITTKNTTKKPKKQRFTGRSIIPGMSTLPLSKTDGIES